MEIETQTVQPPIGSKCSHLYNGGRTCRNIIELGESLCKTHQRKASKVSSDIKKEVCKRVKPIVETLPQEPMLAVAPLSGETKIIKNLKSEIRCLEKQKDDYRDRCDKLEGKILEMEAWKESCINITKFLKIYTSLRTDL